MRHNIQTVRLELTTDDIRKIKRTNLFRFSNDWYAVLYIATVGIYVYSFFFPYYGWRRKPTHIPENSEEYFKQLLHIQLLFLPLVILALSNIIVKRIEIRSCRKVEKIGYVVLKKHFTRRIHLIVFNPLHIILFSNTFKFNDLIKDDKVRIQTTSLGRFLNYTKDNNYVA